jgi:NAD(P)-dependent dehydrogenase (short-subunit alcohol dehydrogenase family)
VLVTGGSGGIGGAILDALEAADYDVVFTYSGSRPTDGRLGARPDGRAPTAMHCDFADPESTRAFCERIRAAEPFYGLVHAAGVTHDMVAAATCVESAKVAMDINFWSLVAVVGAVLRGMTAARAGRIVGIGSVVAHRASRGTGVYAATKAAMEAFLRSIVDEASHRGVTVNTVIPGYIDTRMLEPFRADRPRLESSIPAKRYGTPGDVAAVVAFLLSASASYVNGAAIVVDGGLSAAFQISPAKRP